MYYETFHLGRVEVRRGTVYYPESFPLGKIFKLWISDAPRDVWRRPCVLSKLPLFKNKYVEKRKQFLGYRFPLARISKVPYAHLNSQSLLATKNKSFSQIYLLLVSYFY